MPIKTTVTFIDSEESRWAVDGEWLLFNCGKTIPVSDLPEFIKFLQGEVERLGLQPAPDDDGWIKWNGGECPVDKNTIVDVKFAIKEWDGEHRTSRRFAGKFGWAVFGDQPYGYEIFAYRISDEGNA